MIESLEYILKLWPLAVAIFAFIGTVGFATYAAVKVKLPDLTGRMSGVENSLQEKADMADLIRLENHTSKEIERLEGETREGLRTFIEQCRTNRESCHSSVCREIGQLSNSMNAQFDKFTKELGGVYGSVNRTRELLQNQAVQLARIDERVRVLLGAKDNIVPRHKMDEDDYEL